MKHKTIVVKNLTKSYGRKLVTDNVSVSFYSGEIVALVGHNGAGKTTFLNQLNGLVAVDSGTIQIQGKEITNNPKLARELVSSMPQFQVPLKGVTIREAIECIGALKGMKKPAIKTNADNLITYLAIDKWVDVKGENLSGGLQRLTSFAMSVIDEPSIVILDEPTNDVDPFRRTLIWKYLRKLANSGKTVIIVSHNLFEVERYADRYLLIEKGKIKKDVTISETQNKRQLQHQIVLSILDDSILTSFSQENSYRYDDVEKRLTFSVEEGKVGDCLSTVLELLRSNKIISYEIKLKTLSDDYEEYVNEQ